MSEVELEMFSKFGWGNIYKQLTAMSIHWSKFFFGMKWDNLPKGFTHEDVAQEALRRTFNRTWPDSDLSEEELLKYLFGATKIIVSNLKRSSEIQRTEGFSAFNENQLNLSYNSDPIEEIDYQNVLNKVKSKITGNSNLSGVFDEIRKGHKPKEISELLEVDIKDIYNMNKRIVRIIEEVAIELREIK